MSTYASTVSTAPLSPSELVLLKGEQFAKKSFSGNIKLLHIDNKVSAKEIGQVMLMVALLANEQTGTVHLEVGQKKPSWAYAKLTPCSSHLGILLLAGPITALSQRYPPSPSNYWPTKVAMRFPPSFIHGSVRTASTRGSQW